MITVAEAHEIVGRCAIAQAPVRLALDQALGLRLAADVVSQVDSPPFDKAVVDGYAVIAADESPVLEELELVTAGAVPTRRVSPGKTIRVMTGAPVPAGADAVVKWEDCRLLDGGTIRNPAPAVKAGACIMKRGASFHAGDVLLTAGRRLGPLEIALLAEIGQAEAPVIPRPCVGVLPTGDELVEVHEDVAPGQIRNSNGPMLRALVSAAGMQAVDLGIGRDDPADLQERIARGLACDVLLVSGGVSAGVKDLAPGVLAKLGVQEQFHQVRVKPGKPLWFGVGEEAGRRTLVFGLPGNPVSTLVSFRLFVLPALHALTGDPYAPPATLRATLAKPLSHRGKRPTYHPCRRGGDNGALTVEPLDWKGSADLATLTRADYLAVLAEGDYDLAAGDEVAVLTL